MRVRLIRHVVWCYVAILGLISTYRIAGTRTTHSFIVITVWATHFYNFVVRIFQERHFKIWEVHLPAISVSTVVSFTDKFLCRGLFSPGFPRRIRYVFSFFYPTRESGRCSQDGTLALSHQGICWAHRPPPARGLQYKDMTS